MSAIDDLTADVQEVPDVKAARRALIEYFTGNPDDEFDGPCSVVDAYAAAVRGEAEAWYVYDEAPERIAETRIADLEAALRGLLACELPPAYVANDLDAEVTDEDDGSTDDADYRQWLATANAARGARALLADHEPIAAALDRQVLVVDGVEYEIYGTSAALEILGRALGVPEDAWKTVTICPPIPLTQKE